MDSDLNTEILEKELMKKIVLIETTLKETMNNYILKNNNKIEDLENRLAESMKVYYNFITMHNFLRNIQKKRVVILMIMS